MISNNNNNSSSSSVASIEEALNNAISLVQGYSERNPYDKDPQNPWKNPQAMLEALDQARDKVMVAWHQLESDQIASVATAATTTHHHHHHQQQPDVRALYMDMITDAFADVLVNLRETTDPKDLDVDILVDCLQSGLDLLTAEERGLLCSMQDDDDDDDNDDDYMQEENDDNQEDDNNDEELETETGHLSQNLVTCQ